MCACHHPDLNEVYSLFYEIVRECIVLDINVNDRES